MELMINGASHHIDADTDTPLLWVLRDDLGMVGTKYGCGLAQCGACTVLIDGHAVRSCVTPVGTAVGAAISTIEAVEQDELGKRVVAAWVKHQVPQCGYCQSGQVMAATSLLRQSPNPSDEEIRATMSNLCRCGTYNAISAAVRELAGNPTDSQEASLAPKRQALGAMNLDSVAAEAATTGTPTYAVAKTVVLHSDSNATGRE